MAAPKRTPFSRPNRSVKSKATGPARLIKSRRPEREPSDRFSGLTACGPPQPPAPHPPTASSALTDEFPAHPNPLPVDPAGGVGAQESDDLTQAVNHVAAAGGVLNQHPASGRGFRSHTGVNQKRWGPAQRTCRECRAISARWQPDDIPSTINQPSDRQRKPDSPRSGD